MDPVLLRVFAVVVLVAVVVVVGRWWRSRDGIVRTDGHERFDDQHRAAVGLDLSSAHAGAVLIGSPTCAPCEHAKGVLGDLEQQRDDFTWVYADAAQHRELTGAYRILRVPTVLVVARDGRIVGRSSGVPRSEELHEVLDAAAA